MPKILIADDEENILEFLKYSLEQENYTVKVAKSGKECFEVAQEFQPDLIVLDIMMPEMDGIELCRNLKVLPNLQKTSIIFLTARVEEYSEIAAFEVGADDYIIKPIRIRALIKRIEILLKKTKKDQLLSINSELQIDQYRYVLYQNGNMIELPKKEFEILNLFASYSHRAFSREEILNELWGNDVYVTNRTIDVHIRRLRKKIGKKYIQTVKGVGYRFFPDAYQN